MLQFRQNDTAVAMILTLTELTTLSAPFFLFVFTNVLTKEQVVFVKSDEADESDFPYRYNQFTIAPSDVFAGHPAGAWLYEVYEQADASNLDPSLASGLLENGKLKLDRSADFSYTIYDSPTTYSAYNG